MVPNGLFKTLNLWSSSFPPMDVAKQEPIERTEAPICIFLSDGAGFNSVLNMAMKVLWNAGKTKFLICVIL